MTAGPGFLSGAIVRNQELGRLPTLKMAWIRTHVKERPSRLTAVIAARGSLTEDLFVSTVLSRSHIVSKSRRNDGTSDLNYQLLNRLLWAAVFSAGP